MIQVSTIGLDIAKRVFQVHGVNQAGAVVFRRQLRRTEVLKFFAKLPPCLVGLEACASAHYWGREIVALGHQVRLMPPTRVKPYVKWGKKSDKVDAAACCEGVTRPSMSFVPIKTVESQGALMMHRARQLLVEQRTRLGNAIRGHLAEMGIVAAQGQRGLAALLAMVSHSEDTNVPAVIRPVLQVLVEQWHSLAPQIAALERQIIAWHKSNPDSLRLATQPQFGPIRSCRAPWSPPRATPPGSTTRASSPPGLASCRGRTRPAARNASGASPRPATAICASSWWLPPPG